ncbi:microcystin-dependent protein [Bradyrhizobium sp. i1.3.6]
MLCGPTLAAGTIPGISMTQQLDEFAKPLSGGKLFLIQAGTTGTPQSCYQDTALTLVWPNPVTLDAAGRIPQLFCADGNIKIRLTDKNGNQKLVQDNLLVVGPSGGGGGGGTVDPTTIAATGDLKASYGMSVLSGWVRANGRTIGSSTSGATERANADVQALFQYLWNADANLVVSGGRGVSAAADWAANKTIALPDWRGRTIAGLDDMGNSAAGVLTSAATGFGAQGGSPTVLGNGGGAQSVNLSVAQLPTGITSSNASQSITVNTTNNGSSMIGNNNPAQFTSNNTAAGASFIVPSLPLGGSWQTVLSISGSNSISVTSNNTGGGAHPTVSPTRVATIYIKQ